MRDDNTEPRDNQQIADDSQQSEIDITQRNAEDITSRAAEEEADTPDRRPTGGDRAVDEPETLLD
jgi:hypothetical protein